MSSLVNVSLSLIIVWWPPYVRLVRGAVLAVAAEDLKHLIVTDVRQHIERLGAAFEDRH